MKRRIVRERSTSSDDEVDEDNDVGELFFGLERPEVAAAEPSLSPLDVEPHTIEYLLDAADRSAREQVEDLLEAAVQDADSAEHMHAERASPRPQVIEGVVPRHHRVVVNGQDMHVDTYLRHLWYSGRHGGLSERNTGRRQRWCLGGAPQAVEDVGDQKYLRAGDTAVFRFADGEMWIGRVQSVVVQKQTSRHRFLEPYLDPLDITDPLVRKQAYFVGCLWFSPKASSGRQQRLLYNSVTDHQLYPIQSIMGFVEPEPAGDLEGRLYTIPRLSLIHI